MSEPELLELVLQDEVDRREHKALGLRVARAGFEEEQTLEGFDWEAPVTFDRAAVKDLFSLGFLDRNEDVLFAGPMGVGKTFLASALGHSACRAGRTVLFLRSDKLLAELHQARGEHTHEKAMRRLIAPDLLIIDDFGLRRLDTQQSGDIYQVIIERHRRASTIITSNRDADEWVGLFDDPLLAQSAIDRLANNAHRVIIEGATFRPNRRPGAKAITPPRTAANAPTPRSGRRRRRTA